MTSTGWGPETVTYPCKRCGSREPRHRISLECKVTKRAIGDRVISQVGSQAGDRAGTIVRGYGKSGEYLVRWDERFGTPRESNNSSGWLDREGG